MSKRTIKSNYNIMVLFAVIVLAGRASFVFGQKNRTPSNTVDIEKESTVITPMAPTETVKTKTPMEKALAATPLSGSLNKHSVGIGVGQTFLYGGLADSGGDSQLTGDILYNYSASRSFDFVGNFHYSKHAHKTSWTKILALTASIKAKLFQFDAFAPFVLGGFGLYSPKSLRIIGNQLVESNTKLTFGNNLGVGAELTLNPNFMVWILGHYHNPFDIKQDVGPDVKGHYAKLLCAGFYTF